MKATKKTKKARTGKTAKRPATRRTSRRTGAPAAMPKPRKIEDETPIMPWIIADAVVDEVARYLRAQGYRKEEAAVDRMKEEWSRWLHARANQIYTHDDRFRRQIKGPKGNQGRDRMYMWMRHWLTGRMVDDLPAVPWLLPPGFASGRALPGSSLPGARS
jgi:hypothetical protein